jgi:hypothetical protein
MTKHPTTHVSWGRIGLLMVFLGLSTGILALAGNKPVPGNSNAFGQILGGWLETYWRWVWEGTPLPTDSHGNTVDGKVVLLDIPDTPGDGTPGVLDLTLSSGEAFVLPFFGEIGFQYYEDGSFDPPEDINLYRTLDITVKVDGVVVVSGRNVMDYYAQTDFDPPIPFPEYGFAFAFLQGVGMVHQPLSVGNHVVTLDVKNTQEMSPAYGGGFLEYHNTWNITVKPGK